MVKTRMLILLLLLLNIPSANAIWLNGTTIADSYVQSFNPNTPDGANTVMYLGSNMVGPFSYRTFVRFNLSSIPVGSTIQDANFSFYVTGTVGAPVIGYIWNTSTTWDEATITWNNQPSSVYNFTTIDIPSAIATRRYANVTTAVQSIVNSGTNNGWVIISSTDGQASTFYMSAYTKEAGSDTPWLNVSYDSAPTTPQISSPANNSISDSINITWNTSTDPNGDTINYHYQVSSQLDFSSIINQSNTSNTYSGSIVLSSDSPHYLRVRANDSNVSSAWSNTVTVYPAFVNLYTPANGSTESLASPMSSINFTWSQRGSSYHIVIARDSAFLLNVTDTIVSANYTNQYLSLGSSYWWKVQQYNPSTATYYAWSNVSNFTVNSTLAGGASPDGTTGIQGVVYERKTTGNVPISDARVMLSNLTHFMETTTGSNGYFLFTGLANESDYILQATKKNYDDSVAMPVQTGNGTWVVQNIYMTPCTSSYTCNVNQQFVKFTVQTLFGTKFPNVEANVYRGSDATATYTDTTDAVGVVNFWLIKDQKYRLTFINSSQGINREMNIVASDTEYLVIISGTGTAWQQYTTQVKDAVFTNVTKQVINSTHAFINTSYLDTLEQTTALTVYINQTNASDPYNQTVIQSWAATAPMDNTSHSFVISSYSGQQYLVHYVITHSTYGTVHASYSVSFTKDIIPVGVSSTLLLWFSIIFMVMTGAAFTASTAELGLIVVAVEGWIFLTIGFFEDLNTAQVETGLTIVTVLGVISYIVMKNKREGYA